eukprot:31132-Pelagococcus_subviridis.AAC.6
MERPSGQSRVARDHPRVRHTLSLVRPPEGRRRDADVLLRQRRAVALLRAGRVPGRDAVPLRRVRVVPRPGHDSPRHLGRAELRVRPDLTDFHTSSRSRRASFLKAFFRAL